MKIGALSLGRNQVFVVAGLVTLAPALVLGLALQGGVHGLYCDDYSFRAAAFSFQTGGWQPRLGVPSGFDIGRYLAYMLNANLLNALPTYEVPYNLVVAAIQATNAVLLGALAYRIVRAPLVFVATIWLFLMPALANEAVVSRTAVTHYVLGLLLFLLGFHTVLSAVRKSSYPLLAAAALVLVMVLLFTEQTVFLVLLVPFLSAIVVRGDRDARLKGVIRGTVLCAVMLLGYALYWHFVLKNSSSSNLAARGGFESNPVSLLQRLPTVWSGLIWLLTDWGIRGPLAEALELGMREWSRTWVGFALLAAFLSVVLTAVHSCRPVGNGYYARPAVVWSTVVAGLAWAGLSLVPVLLLKNQIVEIRLLYLAWAGLSIAIAAFIQGLADVSGRWHVWTGRVGVLAVGCILLVSSLTMAGIVRVYQLRWDLDQQQLAALQSAIPTLPEDSQVWVLPVALDERSVSPVLGRDVLLDQYVGGVFQAPWSAAGALRMAYRRPDIYAVATNPWNPLRVTGVDRSLNGQVAQITVQDVRVPVAQLLAFTYQQGRVILLSPIVIGTDHGDDIVVDLPLVALLRGPGSSVEPVQFELEEP